MKELRKLLSQLRAGKITVDEAVEKLCYLPYEDLGFAKPDHHRLLRQGFPEVVLGQGKTPEQVVAIVDRLAAHNPKVLVTRANSECFARVKEKLPKAVYHPLARVITFDRLKDKPSRPGVVIVSGGTADLPVAEEAAVTAELMGNKVDRAYDIGVAGIHRLLDHLPLLRQARVVVAVAGMEGALPSVVAGLLSVPVIAVPTSVGYGANFGGLAPLLGMLNSCAAGVCVVNIDNGFGAGFVAALINGEPGS